MSILTTVVRFWYYLFYIQWKALPRQHQNQEQKASARRVEARENGCGRGRETRCGPNE